MFGLGANAGRQQRVVGLELRRSPAPAQRHPPGQIAPKKSCQLSLKVTAIGVQPTASRGIIRPATGS
jgi:hypothetical protein